MRVSSLDYSNFLGAIAVGRIQQGALKRNMPIKRVSADGNVYNDRIQKIFGHKGLERIELDEAYAGDIVLVTGIERPRISDTLCDPEHVKALKPLTVDEPTVQMIFQVNDSPFSGKEGKYVTSRNLRERLDKELISNVALRVEDTDDPDKFVVCGRGELHLSVLIETMRREGYELAVSKPTVILKEVDGEIHEPYENLTVDVEEKHQGTMMEQLSERKGQMQDMVSDGNGRVRLDFIIPARGLIGFRQRFLTSTQGSGLLSHVFSHYGKKSSGEIQQRKNGVLVANAQGKSTAYALWNLQARGQMVIDPQVEVYEGMIIGLHTRNNDLVVNALRGKQLTNVRASGSDENILLTPPIKMNLEEAIDFIEDDELVEISTRKY